MEGRKDENLVDGGEEENGGGREKWTASTFSYEKK